MEAAKPRHTLPQFVTNICDAHFAQDCKGCPISKPCKSGHGRTTGARGLREWQDMVIAAASEVNQ